MLEITMNEFEENQAENHTRSLVFSWGVMVFLTIISYWFHDHGLSANAAIVAIVSIGFIKVFLVGISFMELRVAPPYLRNTFAIWCVASCVALILAALLL